MEYCKCWNNLDSSYIEKYLDKELEYNSQWVLNTIKGKENYLEYLNGKFKTLKESLELDLIADIGYFQKAPFSINRPCIILKQTLKEKTNLVSLIITSENDKIKTIDMCFIPDPNEAITFNLKLT
jgi:hypothetical protein